MARDVETTNERPASPSEEAEFALVEVGRGGRRSVLSLVVWTAGLALVVAVAVLGGRDERDGDRDETAQEAATTPVASRSHGAVAGAFTLRGTISLTSPRGHDSVETGIRLRVSGFVLDRVDRVEVTLEARGGRIMRTETIIPAPRSGPPIADARLWFGTSFDLPAPRPNGSVWVTAQTTGRPTRCEAACTSGHCSTRTCHRLVRPSATTASPGPPA
jgi:hypothetical protein